MRTSLRAWLIPCLLFATLPLWGCGSKGGGGNEPPPNQPSLMISGIVQAPNALIAFSPKPGFLDRVTNLFATTVNAGVSGISPVPDGTPVELVRINDAGNVVATLATTTTSGGKYSVDLAPLGLSLSTDLVVQVVNPSTGARMRAFVTAETVDIDPISETAVRVVLEQIAASQGTTLGHFTTQEVGDLVASLDLLTTGTQTAVGADIETTVTAVWTVATADTGVMAFIAAASVAGQTTEGPGDIGNFFPMTEGNTWRFQGTTSSNGGPAVNFDNTSMITGTKVIDGVATTVFTETSPDNALGEVGEYYLSKDSIGIAYRGNNDTTDLFDPQIVPYQQVIFPLRLNSTFEQANKKGLNSGEDLDADGINEKVDFTSEVTVAAFEEVVVPAGSFVNSVKIEAKATFTLTFSSDNTKVTSTETQTQWFALGVGPVKRLDQFQIAGESTSDIVTEELTGYFVDGQGKGTVSLTLATGISTADSNESNPGKSGLASDGANYLLASCRELGSSPGIFGVFVSGATAGEPFPIASGDCNSLGGTSENSLSQPSVAFDGTNYLVVFVKGAIIRGIRVSQSGTVLDGPDGFAISTGQLFVISNSSPAVAFDGANYLVVWNKFIPVAGVGTRNIFGARVTPAGQVSSEIPISTEQNIDQLGFALDLGAPSLAFDGTNYLVVWNKVRTGPGSSIYSSLFAVYTDVSGARITPQGAVLDPQGILISTSGPFSQSPAAENVQVAFDETNYLAVWRKALTIGFDPPSAEIRGTRISPDGALLDGPASGEGIGINTVVLSKSEPTVVFDGTNFLVAWVVGAFSNSPPAGIFGAKVSPGGQVVEGLPTTTGISLSDLPPPFTRFHFPVISSNGTNVLLTWVNNIELSGQTKSIGGTLIFP